MSDDLDFMPAPAKPKAEAKAATPSPAAKPSPTATPAASSPSPTPGGSPTGGSAASGSAAGGTTPINPDERVELPTWNRARRKRQANVTAAEQTDAFQRGVRAAGRSVIDFPKLVIGALVIVTATIAGAVVLGQRHAAADAEATRVLASATTAVVRGQVVPAEQLVGQEDEIAKLRFPIHTTQAEHDALVTSSIDAALAVERDDVARDAHLVAAAHQVRLGDFAAALVHYDAFLAEADDEHPLRFLALEGKGIAQEAQDDLEGALVSFQAIAPRVGDFYRHMALYHQGRVLEALGRKDEALAVYEQFFAEFPKPMLPTSMIRERVEQLDPEFAARLAAQPSLESSVEMPEFPTP